MILVGSFKLWEREALVTQFKAQLLTIPAEDMQRIALGPEGLSKETFARFASAAVLHQI